VFKDNKSAAFGIPVDPEWLDVARKAWPEIRRSIKYGPTELTPADRGRTELVLFLADKLRRRGVARPLAVAWDLVGIPDPKEFANKLEPGQPLGDQIPKAILDKYAPLMWSRLKHFRVAQDEDARAAAQLGLLNAIAEYDPAVDVSVGLFAKAHFYIDDEIKRHIRGKESDAWYHSRVSGDERLQDEDGKGGERWETIPKAVLSDQIVAIIESAYDDRGRLQANRPVICPRLEGRGG
jgi:hypothetical protein